MLQYVRWHHSAGAVRLSRFDIYRSQVCKLGIASLHTAGRFDAECLAVGMRISTSMSEAMVFSCRMADCFLQVGGELLPQVMDFKFLRVLFTNGGKMDRCSNETLALALFRTGVIFSVYTQRQEVWILFKHKISLSASWIQWFIISLTIYAIGSHEMEISGESFPWIVAATRSFKCIFVGLVKDDPSLHV